MHEALAAAVLAAATHAAVVVDAAVAALSFVSHLPVAMTAVVVASPLALHLVQPVLLPLERQQLTVRSGFEPQACRVPTRRGIYLFSVTVDIIQVRRPCTTASRAPARTAMSPAVAARACAAAACC